MSEHGKFSDDPVTLWLTESSDDRKMQLVRDFSFTDPAGKVWLAPKDSKVDGASIPRPLWSLVGSPYTGDYRRASIVHDVACDDAGSDLDKRRAADRMFYHACREGGCNVEQATILYLGVRIGAAWPKVPQWTPAMVAHDQGARVQRLVTEGRMEGDFQHITEMVLYRGVVDDPRELERRADEALQTVTAVDVQAP
jgi:hypothetical protein